MSTPSANLEASLSVTPFRFQRFTVAHDKCAMKVGTDGVLLGSWANVGSAKRILDIGTGSGLIALMLAQRSEDIGALVHAIEIDGPASQQAKCNVANSPWQDRIEIFNQPLQNFLSEKERSNKAQLYDLIVCNPPYFESGNELEDEAREQARFVGQMTRESLFENARELVTDNGRLSIVLPYEQLEKTKSLASSFGFSATRITRVRSTPGHDFKRVLLEFRQSTKATGKAEEAEELKPANESEFAIEIERHKYTAEFALLVKDFYLRYAPTKDNPKNSS